MRSIIMAASLLATLCGPVLFGQDEDVIPTAITPTNKTGDLPYSTSIGTDLEHVDLATGNLIVTIPFVSIPGRRMSFDYGVRFDSRFWDSRSIPSGTGLQWYPEMRNWLTANTIGWTSTQAYLTYAQGTPYTMCGTQQASGFRNFCVNSDGKWTYAGSYIFTDRAGLQHSFTINRTIATDPASEQQFDSSNYVGPSTSWDGYFAAIYRFGQYPAIQSPGGTMYFAGGTSGGRSVPGKGQYFVDFAKETDLRGNTQTISPGGLDSIGRTPVTQQISGNQIIYSVHDSNGSPQIYTVSLETIAVATNFAAPPLEEYTATRQTVSSISLPDGRSYGFQYDSFGNITQITTPEGATINYEWSTVDVYAGWTVRAVTKRTVTHDGQSDIWTIEFVNEAHRYKVIVTAPPNPSGMKAQTVYTYRGDPQLDQIQYLSSPGGTELRRYDLTWDETEIGPSPSDLLTSIQTTLDDGKVNLVKFQYDIYGYPDHVIDCLEAYNTCLIMGESGNYGPPTYLPPPLILPGSHGNVTTIQEYDWGQGSPGQLLRQTIRTYQNDNYFIDEVRTSGANGGALEMVNIVNRVASESVYDGSFICTGTGTLTIYDTVTPPPLCGAKLLAKTTVSYDNDTPSTYGYYGEATSVSKWRNVPSDTTLINSYSYNGYGNVASTTDPNGNTTQYRYDDLWYGSSACPTSSPGAYLTSVTNALQQKATQSYYQCTGKLAVGKTPNDISAGRQGTVYTYDWRGRQASVSLSDGGGKTITYDDSARTIDVRTYVSSSQTREILTQLDNLGREAQGQLLSDPEGIIYTKTSYDALGRKYQAWNPYRSTSDSTYGATIFEYDALGRPTQQTDQYGVGIKKWQYSGNTEIYIDENSHQWQRTKDALGNLAQVTEPGSLVTKYTYDLLGNLLRVDQLGNAGSGDGPRTRSFRYDSLSRLVCASNPENSGAQCPGPEVVSGGYVPGTVGYTYDANGNVSSKTDARGVVTNYSYDALNRLISKTYQYAPAGSLASCYHYDDASAGANGIHHLWFEWTQVGNCSNLNSPPTSGYQALRVYGAYDAVGRVLSEQQCVAGYCTSANVPATPPANCTSLSGGAGLQFCYDLAGDLSAYSNGLTTAAAGSYPSAAMSFSQSFDAAGRLATVSSSWGDSTHPAWLFSNATHAPNSALASWLLGTNLWTARQYDKRLRLCNQQSALHQITAPEACTQ